MTSLQDAVNSVIFALNLQENSGWIIQAFIVIFATLCGSFILSRALKRLHKKLEQTRNPWDDAFIDALRRPLRVLIWVIGLSFALAIAHKNTEIEIFAAIPAIRDVSIIAVIGWFILRFIRQIERNLLASDQGSDAEKKLDHSTIDAITKLLRIAVIITFALIIMQNLGFSISGVLAFGGVGGVAVGFAAKDLLANFFGALIIYLDRPFAIGDWIRSPDKDIEGTVEQIGWRQTRIRRFDKRPLYVPNALFSTIAVENPSRMTHRRIYETIGIRYDDIEQMNTITKAVESMLQEHPEIDEKQTLMVNFNSFAPSSVDFFIYTFTHTTNWQKFHEIKQDVLLKISAIITDHGAEIAFPTSTLHIPDSITIEQAAS